MCKAEQNCQTQSGPKHRKKNPDLRHCLKAVGDNVGAVISMLWVQLLAISTRS